jgi:hypothetical protein
MSIERTIAILETDLNNFDPEVRAAALQKLLALGHSGELPYPPAQDVANMHSHTFFSFNGYGHSPTSLAWLAKRHAFKLMGIVDFDVLDGVDEFLAACDAVGVRGSAGIETRVYVPEFANREINSPGEPGIYYHMGIGFASGQVPESAQPILAEMRQRATSRNQAMLGRVNAHLAPVCLDYEREVLPLTPLGNATERHMLAAYIQAAGQTVSDPAAFWAGKLALDPAEVAGLMTDPAKFQNAIRAKLMKKGGIGYIQPSPESFPTVEAFHALILACGALPCATWLDGTSAGETAIEELLELLIGKGVVALNIIPDRNWNIADPALKQLKLHKLYEIVELAQKLHLPLNIGTEMNSFGQKIIDDFAVPELAPVRQAFLDGANFIYGHTVAQRAVAKGYQSDWAKSHFPTRQARNAFYTNLGRAVAPGQPGRATLAEIIDQVAG